MENKDVFETVTEKFSGGIKKTKNVFKQFLNYILLFALILVTAVLSFSTQEIVNPFSPDYLINLAYLIIINIFSMASFIPQGENNEKSKNTSYNNNLVSWGEKSTQIRNDKLIVKFRIFCKELTERLRKEKKDNYLYDATLDFDFYNKYLRQVSNKKLKKFLKPTEIKLLVLNTETNKKEEQIFVFQLSWRQIALIKKFRGIIKVLPINPARVLTGSNKIDQYEVARNKIPYKETEIIKKVSMLISWSVLMASIILVPTNSIGWAAIYTFVFRVFSIISWAFVGFYTGVNQIKRDNQDIKDRIIFMDEFLETQNPKETIINEETAEEK